MGFNYGGGPHNNGHGPPGQNYDIATIEMDNPRYVISCFVIRGWHPCW